MPQTVYECMFILDSNRYARDPGGVSGQLTQMLEKLEGEVLASRLWNEQRLAYPINGHRKGTYWLTYFRLDGTRIGELTRACQLNDNILRHLTLKIDPRLVDTLVAHARGEQIRPVDGSDAAGAGDEADAVPVAVGKDDE